MSLGQIDLPARDGRTFPRWVSGLAEVVKVIAVVVGAGAGPFLLAVTVPMAAWLAPLVAGAPLFASALALGLGLYLGRRPKPPPVSVIGEETGGPWRLVVRAPSPDWTLFQHPEVQLLLDYLRLARVYADPLTPTSAGWLFNVARHAPWELDAPGLEQEIGNAGRNGAVLAGWLEELAARAEAASSAAAAQGERALRRGAKPATALEPYAKTRRLAMFLADLDCQMGQSDATRPHPGTVVALMAARLYGSGSVPGGTPPAVTKFVEYIKQHAPPDLHPLNLPQWVDTAPAPADSDESAASNPTAGIAVPNTLLIVIGLLVLLPGLIALLTQDRGAEHAARAAWYFAAPAVLAWGAAGAAAQQRTAEGWDPTLAAKGRLQIVAAVLILVYLALSYATPVRLVDGPPTRLDWTDPLLGAGCGLALASLLVRRPPSVKAPSQGPTPASTPAPSPSARRNTDE